MPFLGPIKRLFLAGRPAYKRVASPRSRRPSDPPTAAAIDSEDDEDPYDGDNEVVHGGFVYCAFLMLGFLPCVVANCRTGNALAYCVLGYANVAWFSFTTAAAFFREVFASKPALMKSSTSDIAAVATVPSLLVMFILARERTEVPLLIRLTKEKHQQTNRHRPHSQSQHICIVCNS